ncbi:MAG: hypothetical protein FWH44_05060 [Methanomassiliicoccaceae archaeon]|nr:hypothetical protein [Methanomassiliicoccaceae archaeon]
MMIIDTPEKARNLEAAFWEAERRGPLNLDHIDIEEELRRGREFLKNNPNWLKEAAAAAKARLIERGELPGSDE